jgi:microcystin-dependent protein
MSKKIEIFENTLLKLLVRRGIDADRQNIVLSEGELGYTTDTKRLYIGDGQTDGGILIGGNSGTVYVPQNDILTIANTTSGDLAFSTNTNSLYRFKGGTNNTFSNWDKIGGVYTAGNSTVSISNTNAITVGTLSAGSFAANALGSGLTLDSSNRIAISSSNISVDNVSTYTGNGFLGLPQQLQIGNQPYVWPSGNLGTEKYLTTDISGNLSWTTGPNTPTTVFVAGTAGQIPVGSIMPFVSSANAPSGWLLCNGQSVPGSQYRELSAVIGTSFGGNNISFNVPNFINKTLYGVQNTPGSSTLYSVSSGTNSSLSATGALFIIKAKPDLIVSPTFTVTSPLTASLNGVDITNTPSSTLSGNFIIGAVNSSSGIFDGFKNKVINGNFDIWQRGISTLNQSVSSPTIPRTADRWLSRAITSDRDVGLFDVTRRNCTTTELDNFSSNFYLRNQYKNSLGVGTSALYESMSSFSGELAIQNIENAIGILGKTVTLSFWARASQNTKIFSESQIHSSTMLGGSAMSTPTIHKIFDITTNWQKFTHTYTMPTYSQVSAVAYNPNHLTVTRFPFTTVPTYTPIGSFNALPALSSWVYQVDIKSAWSRGESILYGNAWLNGTSYRPGDAVDYPGEAMTPDELRSVATSILSNGGWYDIAQIQLEVGDTATNFEVRPMGTELELCRRYYEIGGTLLPDPNGSHSRHHLCTVNSNTHAGWQFAVGKSGIPSVVFWRPSLGRYAINSLGNIENISEANEIPVTNITANPYGVTYFNTTGNITAAQHTGGLMEIGWEAEAEL